MLGVRGHPAALTIARAARHSPPQRPFRTSSRSLTRLLRALLADGITLAHPLPILSSIALGLQQTKDFDLLVDRVRADLGGWLVGRICPPNQPLPVATLDAVLESAILGGMRDPATGQPMIDRIARA